MTSAPRTPPPRLLCSTVSALGRPLHEAFGLIADAGFDGVEVMITKDPDTRDPGRLRELADEHGLTVEAIHAPFLLMTRSVWGSDPVGKVHRAIGLAEEVGTPLVVVHPPYRWQLSYRRWLAERLPLLPEQTTVKVAVENMFPLRVRGRKVATFHARQAPEDLDGYPHVVLDTSHAAVAGLDLFETLRGLGGRLAHVHLSNNAGKGWDSHLPIDQGVLPLEGFLDSLASEGFAGTISLELDLRPYLGDGHELRRILAHNRELCGSRLSLSV